MRKITNNKAAALRYAVQQLVRAEVADSWKGGGRPEDVPVIEEELRRARTRVLILIARSTSPINPKS